jgi:preprotein translocase subunit SecG
MESLIITVNIILAILLVIVVLMQKSEGGALGIGNSQESFISSRAAGGVLTKVTAILATLFILTSLSLTIISNQQISGTSVIEKIEEKEDPEEPKIPKSN